ncbi:MAG: hypothetical protein HRU19_26175 [Pseudobacteriovorax sp.]|nr:hypothetical protein [Pseudobacteriovorax sp.]
MKRYFILALTILNSFAYGSSMDCVKRLSSAENPLASQANVYSYSACETHEFRLSSILPGTDSYCYWGLEQEEVLEVTQVFRELRESYPITGSKAWPAASIIELLEFAIDQKATAQLAWADCAFSSEFGYILNSDAAKTAIFINRTLWSE